MTTDRDQATRDRLAEALAGRWLSYGDDKGSDDLTEHPAMGLGSPRHTPGFSPPNSCPCVREGQAEALAQWARTFRVVAVAAMTRQRRRIGNEVADLLEAEAAALRAPREATP